MTDVTGVIGLALYARRPAARARTGPPCAALVFWMAMGIAFILLASQGGPGLAEACEASGVSICGP